MNYGGNDKFVDTVAGSADEVRTSLRHDIGIVIRGTRKNSIEIIAGAILSGRFNPSDGKRNFTRTFGNHGIQVRACHFHAAYTLWNAFTKLLIFHLYNSAGTIVIKF